MDWNYWASDLLGGPLLGGITAVLQGEAVLSNTFSGWTSQSLVVEGLKLFLFGILLKHLLDSFLQTLRHFFEWIDDRFRPRTRGFFSFFLLKKIIIPVKNLITLGISVSAEFKDGDAPYAWIMTYMVNNDHTLVVC